MIERFNTTEIINNLAAIASERFKTIKTCFNFNVLIKN